METCGKIVKKEQAKMKAKYDPIESIRKMFAYQPSDIDEVKAIYDSIVAEEEEATKAAASGKNISTKSLFVTAIPPFPTDIESWGKLQGTSLMGEIYKRQEAKMKAKGKKVEVDDEAAVIGKKRSTESASKTTATEKKAKLISLAGQKTGGNRRKGAHTTTPHPAKTGKTPTNNDKSKQQTPKSSGSATCKSCNKSFNSDNAFQAHTKAKHSTTK